MATEDGSMQLDPGKIAVYAVVVVLLVLGAGLMSGLTLGLLSLDVMDLEVLKAAGAPKQRRAATRLIALVAKPHWLLCTLLLCNAACMEALPLFLDRLLNPMAAILLSVTAILLFGEIIPQAVCSRYGVAIGAWFAPIVRVLMWICSPITWPLAKLLDWILGHEESAMQRRELKAMVQLHTAEAGFGGALTPQEVAVIHGAMDLTNKTALAAMTPIDKVFMVSDSTQLDDVTVRQVLLSGHSRLPVYRGNNKDDICGVVLVKEMLQFWRAEVPPSVDQLDLRHIPRIPADTPMFDVLRLFQTGNSHMALLLAPEGTDIEELKKTRGRLESKDNDTSASAGTAGKPTSADKQDGSSLEGPFTEEIDGERNAKAKKKRVSWRIGSRTNSSRDSSRGGSQHDEFHHCQSHDKAEGVVAPDQENTLGPDADEDRDDSSSSSSSGGGSSDGVRRSKGSRIGRLLNRVSRLSTDATRQQQQREVTDLEMGKVPAAAAGSASYCSSGCCIDAFGVVGGSGVKLVPVGIITLEDVMEELLQVEIVDETDTYIDNLQTEKVDIQRLLGSLPPHLQSLMRAEMLAAAQNFIRNSALTPVPGRIQGGIPHHQGLVSQDSHGAPNPSKNEMAKALTHQQAASAGWPVSAMLGRPLGAFGGAAANAAAGGEAPVPAAGGGAQGQHAVASDAAQQLVGTSDLGATQGRKEGRCQAASARPATPVSPAAAAATAAAAAAAKPAIRKGTVSESGSVASPFQAAATAVPSAVAGGGTGTADAGDHQVQRRQHSNPLPGYVAAGAAASAGAGAPGSSAKAFKSVRSSNMLLPSAGGSEQLHKLLQ